MSKIEFSHTNKNGEKFEVSGEGQEVEKIAKLILTPFPSFGATISMSPLLKSFSFEEDEKPMKSKAIIKKVNVDTIEVDNLKLSLSHKRPGTDYYVYKEDSGTIFISDDKGDAAKLLGGFHYGVIPEDFEPINGIDKNHAKKIAGINAYSIWDEKHRSTCSPEGMFYVSKLDAWFDIYFLNANHKDVGTSAAGHPIAAGSEYNGRKIPHGEKNLKCKVIDAIAKHHGKRLLTKEEFQIIADGVKENISANGLDDGTTKFIEDFTSKYGMIQATGVQWTWTSTPFGDNSAEDEDNRYICGGSRSSACPAGSRCANWCGFGWYDNWRSGVRFACDPLNPVK